MNILAISGPEVRRLLPMGECIELMAGTLRALARGEALNPLRSVWRVEPTGGLVGLMPGYLASPARLGLKAITVFPENQVRGLDSHQGVVLLFEPEQGAPVAIVDASEITAIRTAAVSGVATRLLAREEAGDLAILGSGVQARTHLQAMLQVRELRRVRVFSRNRPRLARFVAKEQERHAIPVEAVGSAREAVEEADLICTTTASREPLLLGRWLAPGCHVNAVGSSVATARELDTTAVTRARLFVDCRESCVHEAGDYLIPLREGAIDEGHIVAELGEVLLARIAGRRDPQEITLFKSLGLAVEDLAAAHHVYVRALEEGAGRALEL